MLSVAAAVAAAACSTAVTAAAVVVAVVWELHCQMYVEHNSDKRVAVVAYKQ
jgi:hypothetical protein